MNIYELYIILWFNIGFKEGFKATSINWNNEWETSTE